MKVIIGLGNPEPRYALTRHNVGWMALQRLADHCRISLRGGVCSAKIGEGTLGEEPLRLVAPQRAMNSSGESVGCLVRRWRLDAPALLVLLDDVSLPLGLIRIRPKGSAGGHLGLASVMEALGTEQVPRLRVGIGPGPGAGLAEFVLARFALAERKNLEEGLTEAVAACETWVKHGIPAAMNRFNRRRGV